MSKAINGQNVYVVTMYRWGSRENHSYVLGVFSTKPKAIKGGEKERENRGGNKYYQECIEVPINKICNFREEFKEIVNLEKNQISHEQLKKR